MGSNLAQAHFGIWSFELEKWVVTIVASLYNLEFFFSLYYALRQSKQL